MRVRGIVIVLLLLLILSQGVFAGDSRDPRLTEEERSWLDSHPDDLVLYYNIEFPPIEFRSPAGSFTGLGADVIGLIEEILGISFIMVPSDDWNDHLAALESGRCAVAPTIVKTPARDEYAFFTTPYATAPVVIITPSGEPGQLSLKDLAGRRVGVVSGFATEQFLRDQALFAGFEVVTLPDVREGLRSVSFGRVDAFVENLAVAAYYIEELGLPNLKAAGETDYSFSWSIGVSREYPLLYSSIQKALSAISGEKLAELRSEWIALDVDYGLSREMVLLLIVSAVFLVLLVTGLAGFTMLLKRRLRKNISELKDSERRYRRLAENSPAVVFQLMMKPGGELFFPYLGGFFYTYTGISPDEMAGNPAFIVSLIYEEDLPRLYTAIETSAETLTPLEVVFRLMKGERILWIEAHATPERQQEGSVLWDGLALDITDRKASEFEVQARLKEKELLLQEIHHRVKNNLTVISSLLNLRASTLQSPEDAMKAFRESRDRILSMALIYEQLYESDNFIAIDLKEYLTDLTTNLLSSPGTNGNVSIDIKTEGLLLGVDSAVPLGLIINELVTNALLHAFPAGADGRLFVDLAAEDNDWYILTIRDNGIGFSGLPEKGDTMGLTMVNLLVDQIGGTLTRENGNGTCFKLRFPR